MLNNKTFKISSGLKNLIGKELITDEYIAIFELVKNSYDAHASDVKVVFENIYQKKSRILIIDNGKGMNLRDIDDKWLFVAYSAKKDGTEDDDLKDYRDKIQPKKVFAGAKGVGRFSCDRLGSSLNMITIKKEKSATIQQLKVNWNNFEEDLKEEFVEVGIEHHVLDSHSYNIDHGTVLQIENLRDEWNRDKLLKLKKSLEKLINPNEEKNNFSIEIIAEEEEWQDQLEEDEWNKVNGVIRNTVFESLNLKTTHIINEVSEDGSEIITTLYDRGKFIYKIVEKNKLSLRNIQIKLFYLNRAAKLSFSKLMGITSVQYGSVFLYKNNFRIYPFGEVGFDPFGLDKRKAQGQRRYLGTRELIGRIEIFEGNDELIEVTSRDGGFIKNPTYNQLVDLFIEKSLKTLEKYVVNIIRWGEPLDNGEKPALNPEDVKNEILTFIKKITNTADDVISIEYNEDFLELIEESQKKSATNILADLAKRAIEKSDDPNLHKGIEEVSKKFNQLLHERKEIEKEKEQTDKELRNLNKELDQTTSQNLFLKSVTSADAKELISLQHQINHGTNRINMYIDRLKKAIQNGAPLEKINSFLEVISLENNKISTISKFVTKANFNLTASMITNDIINFIEEYIENVYKEYRHHQINNKTLQIIIEPHNDLEYIMKFRPLEVIIIVDNLLNNSIKARAQTVIISWGIKSGNVLEMIYKDDGMGIPDEHVKKVFDFGFTTTSGSGLGLYHIEQIIKKMGGTITINNKVEKGVEFILEVRNGS